MDSRKAGLWKGRLCDDGILAETYNYFWLVLDGIASGAVVPPCGSSLSLSIPDTILYERGFPKAWYAWEKAARGDGERTLRKHLGKDIAVPAILKKFCPSAAQSETVVAEYITLESTATGQPKAASGSGVGRVHIQYLTPSGLADFLSSRAPGNIGVLQRFVPAAGMFNTTYEVVWSPSASSIAQARSAVPTSDTLLPLRERFATFDADPAQLRRVKISPQSHVREKLLCSVTDLMRIMSATESVPLLGVVLYCKIDHRGSIWLTFCSSIRCKTVESANGLRDPLAMGANFTESPSSLGAASPRSAGNRELHSLPPSKPHNAAVNMRAFPRDVKVRLVAGGRTSPLIVGQAYDVTSKSEQCLDLSAHDNDQRLRDALDRLDALHDEGTAPHPPSMVRKAMEMSTASATMPPDHHREERQALLLFLEDMAYLTRANRDRQTQRARMSMHANALLPPFFNQGTAFHFRIPPVLDRALGASGLATLCRLLGWTRTASLSDAHGHNSDYFAFPWRASVATNEELIRSVMAVYPPVVLRKGRRSVAAKSLHGSSMTQLDHSDEDDEEDNEGVDRHDTGSFPTVVSNPKPKLQDTPGAQAVTESGNEPSGKFPQSHDMPIELEASAASVKLFPFAKRDESPSHLLLKRSTSAGWRLTSSFPTLQTPAKPPRKPLSARERETQCKLTASRKRIYYPEGAKEKPGPTIQRWMGKRAQAAQHDSAPMSDAAAQFMKKRNNAEGPDDWAQRAPFASADAAEPEQRPLDIMMQFWTQ